MDNLPLALLQDATITSYFSYSGSPAVGLQPTVSVWKVGVASSLAVNDQPMQEVGGGFYQYLYTAADGYDVNEQYTVIADGGAALGASRYGQGSLAAQPVNVLNLSEIESSVWDASLDDHTAQGTFGHLVQLLRTISAQDITRISSAVWDELLTDHTIDGSASDVLTTALDVVVTTLKYQQNRTKIDPIAKTLTVYDNDQVTPLRVFTLKDRQAAPSVNEVFERTIAP